MAMFDRKLDSIWSFNIKTRWADQSFDQRSQTTLGAAPDSPPRTWAVAEYRTLPEAAGDLRRSQSGGAVQARTDQQCLADRRRLQPHHGRRSTWLAQNP